MAPDDDECRTICLCSITTHYSYINSLIADDSVHVALLHTIAVLIDFTRGICRCSVTTHGLKMTLILTDPAAKKLVFELEAMQSI